MSKRNIILLIICTFCMFINDGTFAQDRLNMAFPDSLSVPLLEIQDQTFAMIFDSLQKQKHGCVFSSLGIGTYSVIVFVDDNRGKQLRLMVYQISSFFTQQTFAGYEIHGAFYYNDDLTIVRIPDLTPWCAEKYDQIFKKTDDSLDLHFKTIHDHPLYKNKTSETVRGKIKTIADSYFIIYEEKNGVFVKMTEESCITDMENYKTF